MMSFSAGLQQLRLCLICDDEAVRSSVLIACPTPHTVQHYSALELTLDQGGLSNNGHSLVDDVTDANALLINWDPLLAPVFNTITHHIHKKTTKPVIALCGGAIDEQVSALAAGVDATLTFPLYLPLIQFRIAAYQRTVQTAFQRGLNMSKRPADPPSDSQHLRTETLGKLRLDVRARKLYIESATVPLTPREFTLLSYMVENAGAACSRQDILEAVWGISFDTGTNMVDVYMYFLRKKLHAHGLTGAIETVRGHGYRLTLT